MSDSEPEDSDPPQAMDREPPTRPKSPSTREDFIAEALSQQGFEEETIPFISKPQRDSSCNVYDAYWGQFLDFCKSKNWNPALTNAQRMCTYLIHLFEEGKQVNTIECVHAALKSVLRHYGYPQHHYPGPVKDCIKSFWKARPRTKKVCTEWDVNHVLDSFLKPPYVDEDMDDSNIPLKTFTIKVAFLTALACSRRKSEIHAFSRSKGLFRTEKDSNSGQVVLTINTHIGFVAKNQKARDLYPPVTLQSIFHEYQDKPEDALLCPVRAITKYVDRTKDMTNDKKLLLIHPQEGKKATAASLACWLKAAISSAYTEDATSPHCSPHEIRAIAASLSAFNHASVADILEAGTWKSYSTFTNNYLKDVGASVSDRGTVYRIPTFIAAGNRIANS